MLGTNNNSTEGIKILNYIRKHNLSDLYSIVSANNVNEILDEEWSAIIAGHSTVDDLIESMIQNNQELKHYVYIMPKQLPSSISRYGQLIGNCSFDNSFFSGREYELEKMFLIRQKKIKRNILLVGNPGVGKTSLVYAFSHKYNVQNILVIESAKLVSDTEYRGSFEARVVELLKFAQEMNFSLFFDEIHALVDLGKSTGGISLTDILKPYLLDSSLSFFGATTIKELPQLMHDEAFKRRFSVINVIEPDLLALVKMKNSFEKRFCYNTSLSEADTMQIIQMLDEMLPSYFFPDKLIDFLDYYYAFQSVHFNADCRYEDLLKEYINDQEL